MNPLRIANCSGFYGDRVDAAREMVEGGPIDVLTGDYLAELTMLILWKARQRNGGVGYATTFLTQMDQVLGTCLDRGIKVVTNAGGLDPGGLAQRLRELAGELGLSVRVAHVAGDDLLDRLGELQAAGHKLAHLDTGQALADAAVEPVTANAYLGGWGIAEALAGGADVVVCPRVTDASLAVGPASWHFGWRRDDWDRLAGAVVAGHIIECGPHATGGNYAFFDELPDHRYPGFPIAEVHDDGSCVILKHPGTGGLVSVGTVTAQILYEIAEPAYVNPDVVARFDTIALEPDGPDRVRVAGVRGEPPPPDLKVAINYEGGYRNAMTLVVPGLDVEAKAAMACGMLFDLLGGREQFARVDTRLEPVGDGRAHLTISVRDPDRDKVGRRFSNAVIELILASYPGFHTTTPPSRANAYGVYWPTLVPAEEVDHVAIGPDGDVTPVPHTHAADPTDLAPLTTEVDPPPTGPPIDSRADGATTDPRASGTTRVALGTLFGARSGDKGGNANVGVWARDEAGYAWLAAHLTAERFRELIADAAGLEVRRYELANLRALNFVVVGLLGEGVASSVRPDPQAKGLGEELRACPVDLPAALLSGAQA